MTKLLQDAKDSGIAIVTGLDMFIMQTHGQYERFTNLPGKFSAIITYTLHYLWFIFQKKKMGLLFFPTNLTLLCMTVYFISQHQRNPFGKSCQDTKEFVLLGCTSYEPEFYLDDLLLTVFNYACLNWFGSCILRGFLVLLVLLVIITSVYIAFSYQEKKNLIWIIYGLPCS